MAKPDEKVCRADGRRDNLVAEARPPSVLLGEPLPGWLGQPGDSDAGRISSMRGLKAEFSALSTFTVTRGQ